MNIKSTIKNEGEGEVDDIDLMDDRSEEEKNEAENDLYNINNFSI